MNKEKEVKPQMEGRSKAAGYVEIEADRCKGCYLCISSCPHHLIEIGCQLNSGGYYPAVPKVTVECTACGLCWQVCPDVAIRVYRTIEDRDT